MEENQQKNPFGEVNYSDYGHPKISFADNWKELEQHNHTIKNLTNGKFCFFDNIIRELEHSGFRKISKTIFSGTHAVVLEANNHQMIRIVDTDVEQDRPSDPIFLQPIYSIKNVQGYSIEVLPKVHTLFEISRNKELMKEYNLLAPSDIGKLIENLMIKTAHDGKFFFDSSSSNIAVIKDENGKNVPIIIDSGAVIDASRFEMGHLHNFSKICLLNAAFLPEVLKFFKDFIHLADDIIPLLFKNQLNEYQNRIFLRVGNNYLQHLKNQPIPAEIDYEAAQEHHLKLLGLTKGEITGVFTQDEIIDFITNRLDYIDKHSSYNPASTVFIRMITDGTYKDQAGKIYNNALNSYERASEKREEIGLEKIGLCHYVEIERERRAGKNHPTTGSVR